MRSTAPTGLAEVVQRVRPVLEADEHVRFAYVFGSTARGEARGDSDIDLAVYRDPVGTLMDEARLHGALAAALGREDVDMVTLNQAPMWLQYRILGEGTVVFTRDERQRIAFRARVEKEFLDFRPYHDEYLAATRERARRGVLKGG